MPDDKKKRLNFGRDKAEASVTKKKRQERFSEMCKEYMDKNPTAKRCKLTPKQDAELKAMVTEVQGALNRQSDPNYKPNRAKDKAIIKAKYNNN